jgi:hypothetical protein
VGGEYQEWDDLQTVTSCHDAGPWRCNDVLYRPMVYAGGRPSSLTPSCFGDTPNSDLFFEPDNSFPRSIRRSFNFVMAIAANSHEVIGVVSCAF